MKPALRQLLDDLDEIAELHEEVGDTEVREAVSEAVHRLPLIPNPGYVLPNRFGMFSDDGDRLVLIRFFAHPEVVALALGTATKTERLAAFQDESLQSAKGSYYDGEDTGMGDVDRARELFIAAGGDPNAARRALLQALNDSDQLVRVMAAVQLASRRLAAVPGPVVGEMVSMLLGEAERLCAEPAIYCEYSEATASDDDVHDLGQDLALALANLPAGSADWAVIPLAELWRNDRQFYEVAWAAIALAFAPTEISRSAQDLSKLQRHVLAVLVQDKEIWRCGGDTDETLAQRGLPATRDALRAFLSANVAGGGAGAA